MILLKVRNERFFKWCLVIFFALLIACSKSNDPQDLLINSDQRQFKVSVSSEGQQITDFDQPLLERISVRKNQVERVLAVWPKQLLLPFRLVKQLDNIGKIEGFRVVQFREESTLFDLGLKEGDLVTAVGRNHLSDSFDIIKVFEELAAKESSSLTFEREGKPRKILYYRLDK